MLISKAFSGMLLPARQSMSLDGRLNTVAACTFSGFVFGQPMHMVPSFTLCTISKAIDLCFETFACTSNVHLHIALLNILTCTSTRFRYVCCMSNISCISFFPFFCDLLPLYVKLFGPKVISPVRVQELLLCISGSHAWHVIMQTIHSRFVDM